MKSISLANELAGNSYPGRGIVIGKSADGKYAVTAYFIMGRSENSRNRVFVEDGEGIRTQAFDPSKLSDPSLIIYAPVRVDVYKRQGCVFMDADYSQIELRVLAHMSGDEKLIEAYREAQDCLLYTSFYC